MRRTLPQLHPLCAAAHLLSVPKAWLAAEADAGRVPFVLQNGERLFHVPTVERLLIARGRELYGDEVPLDA